MMEQEHQTHTPAMSADEIFGLFVRYGRNKAPHILYDLDEQGLVSEQDFPRLLATAYTMCEYPTDYLDIEVWVAWFGRVGFRDSEGKPIERPTEKMVLYRGALPENRHSLSWTIDREQAQWFANRIPGAKVYRLEASPNQLLADYRGGGRGEAEMVVRPYELGGWNVTQVGEGVPGGEESEMVSHMAWLSNRA